MFVATFLLDTKHHNIEKYLHKVFWFSFLMKNNLIKQTNINLSKLKCDIQLSVNPLACMWVKRNV